MRKLFTVFLSLLYLVLSSGFTRYSHVCASAAVQQFSLSGVGNADTACPVCVLKDRQLKQKKKGCCRHEAQLVKIGDAAKKQSGATFVPRFWGAAIPNHMLGAVFEDTATNFSVSSPAGYSSTQPLRGAPLYILHCIYRI